MEEAVVILDSKSNVVFWNSAAAKFTGYPTAEVLAHACPDLIAPQSRQVDLDVCKPSTATLNHRSGYTVPGMLRVFELQDALGTASGKTLLFYPIAELDIITDAKPSDPIDIERSHGEMKDRLEAAHHQWMTGSIPYGLLSIDVDQAESLRISHGRDACESMLRTVRQTLARHMKPSEIIGRWETSEFLVLTHERTPELLLEHAQRLASIARTADFRWWGDRVGLTVSIGTAFATDGHTLRSILSAAHDAMHSATYAGGNQAVETRGC